MPKTTAQLSVDTTTKLVILNISGYESITISYDAEADFTGLVESFLLLMDQNLQITLSVNGVEEGDDQKLDFVIQTIKEIVESYNTSFEDDAKTILIIPIECKS
jgi:hypothetical protein